MHGAGANTKTILALVQAAKQQHIATVDQVLDAAPAAAANFVQSTLHVIRHGSMAAQAAAFTFGSRRRDARHVPFSRTRSEPYGRR